MGRIKVVHYLNQFFAQIGGEERRNSSSVEGGADPCRSAFEKESGDRFEVVRTIIVA
jgi:glycine reductase